MKNIHVFQTDKPSRLWINNLLQGKLELSKEVLPYNTSHNIYIISDEEIKEGIYTIDLRFNTIVKITTLNIEDCKIGFYDGSLKKIILTTDQELIKDNVQEIPYEFLEWFVKNSSCEEVEVEIDTYIDKDISESEIFTDYTIIIPKEELEQERSYSEEEVKSIVNKTVDKFCTFFSEDLKQKVAKDWFEQFKKK